MEGENQQNASFLGASIVVAALLISGSILYSKFGSDNKPVVLSEGVEAQASLFSPEADLADDDVILGDPKAPVTVVIFGDFQCPYCGRLFETVEGRLKDEYVKTGKVRLVARDFPIDSIHPYARPASEAAECARDQGKYWLYHDTLYSRQAEIPSLNLFNLAEELGLDKNKFSQCVLSGKYKNEVEKDYQAGIALDISGTPTSFVNEKRIGGAQAYSVFKAAIEAELAK